ncbi:MAG TPA: hypothetical protein VIO61_16290 [Anaerolineaceae bacterium]
MSGHKRKTKLAGPWQNIQTAIWLFGLAILFWQGWWWPGILILVGISILAEVLVKEFIPGSIVVVDEEKPPVEPPQPAPVANQSPAAFTPPPAAEHPVDLLPLSCPRCGGPVRGHAVPWTGANTADCPYCGAPLPMKTNQEG